jgi:hypothetical protein
MSTAASPLASANPNPGSTAAPGTDGKIPAAGAAAGQPELAAMQKQLTDMKSEMAEKDRAIEFWANKAKAAPASAAPKAEEVEDDTDILEAITTRGAKGFDEIAKKRGFIKGDDVDSRINSTVGRVTKEQELKKQYPELNDSKSEFFKLTADNYGVLVKAGTAPAVAMEMAAAQTELQLLREGKRKLPAQQKADDDAQKEKDRKARIKAQSGEGGRTAPAAGDETDDELTDEQKRICSAMGISEAQYKERAKTGVAMKGIGR